MNSYLDHSALLLKAKKKIEAYKTEIKSLRQGQNEAIAIVGIACQFPGANSHQTFWENIVNGKVCLTHLSQQARWPFDQYYHQQPGKKGKFYCPKAGLIDNFDQFDPALFNLSPREVIDMDPQQRLLLMTAFTLFEEAGYPPYHLPTNKVGVFIGIMNRDYSYLLNSIEAINEYSGTGSAISIAAGRISHTFGLTGPSLAIDTACSSSLVAVHQASLSLKMGECEMAIAGGVNLLLSPDSFVGSSQANMLSPTGECLAFDAKANGYVRAEGCGLVLLKLLSKAEKDQDNIFAIINGSAINHDGHSQGLTVPNSRAQRQVMIAALDAANTQAKDIDYLEAHGTGTKLGDPIESQSIQLVYGQDNRKKPLYIGSVKSNIGHAESAAGIAGLIKVILSLYYRCVPPQPLIEKLNPLCDFDLTKFNFATQPMLYEKEKKTIQAGISAFSFSGTNAHIILSSYQQNAVTNKLENKNQTLLLTLSAASSASLAKLHALYADFLRNRAISLPEMCANTQLARSHFQYRSAIIGRTHDEFIHQLNHASCPTTLSENNIEICFVFRLLNKLYIKNIISPFQEIYYFLPIFKVVMNDYKELLFKMTGHEFETLMNNPTPENLLKFDNLWENIEPILQIIYATVWERLGVVPKRIIVDQNTSFYSALVFAGVLGIDDIKLDQQDIFKKIKLRWSYLKYPIYSTNGVLITFNNIADIIIQKNHIKENNSSKFINIDANFSIKDILTQIKALYLSGYNINWQHYYHQHHIKYDGLPSYPFDLKKFWLPFSRCQDYLKSGQKNHRHLGERLHLPGNKLFYKQTLSLDTHTFLSDHVVFNQVIFPAAAYIVIGLSLIDEIASGCSSYHLEHLSFLQPLILNKQTCTLVTQVMLEKENNILNFNILATPLTNDDKPYVTYATGKLKTVAVPVMVETKETDHWTSYDVEAFYSGLAEAGLKYGINFRKLATIEYTDKSVKGDFTAENISFASSDFSSIISVIDAGLQLIGILNHLDNDNIIYLPSVINHIVLHDDQGLISKVLVSKNHAQDDNMLSYDLVYQDKDGRAVLTILSLKVRPISTLKKSSDSSHYYILRWKKWSADKQTPIVFSKMKHIIIKDRECNDFQKVLTKFHHDDSKIFFFDQIKEEALAIIPASINQILIILPTINSDVIHPSSHVDQVIRIYYYIFTLLQNILHTHNQLKNLAITFICKNCFLIDDDDHPHNFSMSLFQGMIKSIIQEHSDLSLKMIELDPEIPYERFQQALYQCDNLIISCRFSGIFYQEMIPYTPHIQGENIPSMPISYLILGGLGGLGKIITEWLIQHGIKTIILVGRSALNTEIDCYCNDLSKRYHVQIKYYSLDTTDSENFLFLKEKLITVQRPLGVIDAVGHLADGFLYQQKWLRYSSVLKTKIATAWFLHCYLADVQDFILFSSAASLLGSTGQTNYSAANAYLDGLALYRRSLGLPAMTVNWGAWSETGMTSHQQTVIDRVEHDLGISTISLSMGVKAFSEIYQYQLPQIAVIPIQWNQYQYYYPKQMTNYYLHFIEKKMPKSNENDVNISKSSWLKILATQLESKQQRALIQLIENEIKILLHLEQDQHILIDKNFFEIGIDSLIAVELLSVLKNKLGWNDLPTTLIFDCPNLNLLSTYLLKRYRMNDNSNNHQISNNISTIKLNHDIV